MIVQFGLYILGLLVLGYTFRRAINKEAKKETWKNVLEEEQQVQFTRPKELSEEALIHVDLSKYPVVENVECESDYALLKKYATLPMVNLNKFTNLELKRAYGPQMLSTISQYEANYIQFIEASITYGKNLYEHGYLEEARKTLETCISYNCDVSHCYMLLIQIYKVQNDEIALKRLEPLIKQKMQNSPFLDKVLNCL